jgi:hypothetical protein
MRNMKKPSKTAAELEASIKVEMEDICDWPTDMTISVQPDGDSWKVQVMPDRREMIEQIAARTLRHLQAGPRYWILVGRRAKCSYFRYPPPERRRWMI